ncbi:PadR family transcriptional regulator [Actinotalea sp. C106]|uniref:PadR family transcriptional regulator n=1 Tax=Actinotalea sp. C106 TaxID=2908644 RepID=UPI00202943C0|nr:PadR family transcriptional regulator [Actinotalea sp. C106]
MASDGGGERGSRLLRGILDACLLALVAEQDRYGYELAAALREAGLGMVRDGSIYPLVSRLEAKGLLDSYVAPSTSGPGRRYYRITDAGRRELWEARTTWKQVATGVDAILHVSRQGD